jgi:hypothetical protein
MRSVNRKETDAELHKRPLTKNEREQIVRHGDEHKSHWNDLSSSLQKWLFATLITLNLGGMAYSINLNVHPTALQNASRFFFGGLVAALLAGVWELIRIHRIQELVYRVRYNSEDDDDIPNAYEFKRSFGGWNRSYITLAFAALSVGAFATAGNALIDGTRKCTADMFRYADENNTNEHPAGRNSTVTCYFYEIEGLPNDPLTRARFETELIKKMRQTERK